LSELVSTNCPCEGSLSRQAALRGVELLLAGVLQIDEAVDVDDAWSHNETVSL
jgi:hypothetical protein